MHPALRTTTVMIVAVAVLGGGLACSPLRRPGAASPPSDTSPGPMPGRPIAALVAGEPNATLSSQAAQEASRAQPGAGPFAAVVFGNLALLAPMADLVSRGPGNAPAAPPAWPGGQSKGGLTAPNGVPGSSGAAPGGNTYQRGSGGGYATGGTPGGGSSPHDMLTRVADHVRERMPQIAEVRFATDAATANRVLDIAAELRAGRSVAAYGPELLALYTGAAPAGTYRQAGSTGSTGLSGGGPAPHTP